MRLIDADALKQKIKPCGYTSESDEFERGKYVEYQMLCVEIDDAPTVDAVQVVRCKDCKYWERKDGLVIGYCGAAKHGYKSTNWDIGIYRMTMDTGYCSDGEKDDSQ